MDMELRAVAVSLDLVHPLGAHGACSRKVGSQGSMNRGKGARVVPGRGPERLLTAERFNATAHMWTQLGGARL